MQRRILRSARWKDVRRVMAHLTGHTPAEIHVQRFDDSDWHGWMVSFDDTKINVWWLADVFDGGMVVGDNTVYIEEYSYSAKTKRQ